jgi:cell division protein FtsI (penicillin-binding protein 3)
MVALSRFDDNPCHARHFKPPRCAPVIRGTAAEEAIETGRNRVLVAAALFVLVFALLAARLVDVMIFGGGMEARKAKVNSPPVLSRADILDREGRLLATSLKGVALYADPQEIRQPQKVARSLARALPAEGSDYFAKKLTESARFVWLKRFLSPRQEDAVNRLGVPGLDFLPAERRFYPYGPLLAHVVGFANIDDTGLAGVEGGLNRALLGRTDPLPLAVDVRLQYILHHELRRVVEDFAAKAAAGLIMNVNTGEILALVSLPDFDPNRLEAPDPDFPKATLKDRLFDRATLGSYEIGSLFKIFTIAMALDSGTVTMTSRFDATHPIHIGRFTISDYHGKHRPLSVPEILAYSSNIGAAKIALACGARLQQEYLKRFGLLSPPSLELSELGRPHYPRDWRPINVMTIGFGHGISETLVQLASAAAALVNGGILRPASLLKLPPGYAPQGRRVISRETSERMRKLLRLVVEYGTGQFAEAPGYVVGGKTGTAERVEHGVYDRHSLRSSFLGVFPMQNPKYLILTMVDRPHGNQKSHGYATAGWTAAPATKRIVERIAPLLRVRPVDETSPAIADALAIASLKGNGIAPY